MRAHFFAQGVALPPRGSAQDEILRAIHIRSLNEKFSQVQLFARLIAAGLKIEDAAVERMLDLYLLELTQERYTPHVAEALRAAREMQKAQAASDAEMMDRVAKLTVPDDPSEPIKR